MNKPTVPQPSPPPVSQDNTDEHHSVAAGDTKKELTLQAVLQDGVLQGTGTTYRAIKWVSDGSGFFHLKRAKKKGSDKEKPRPFDIHRYDLESQTSELLVPGDEMQLSGETVRVNSIQPATNNQDRVLLLGQKKSLWRHSSSSTAFILDVPTKRVVAVGEASSEMVNPKLSPDGSSVAYSLGRNLFVFDYESGKSRRVTQDGSENILNGIFDWAYEEEFGTSDAIRWSPDSRKVAFWRMDQSQVETFHLVNELPTHDTQYNELTPIRYPKTGTENATVKIGIYDVGSKRTTWADFGDNNNVYIPRLTWTPKSDALALHLLNRQQNHLTLLLADPTTGKTTKAIEDKNNAWIGMSDDFTFLKNSEELVWTSEKSGFNHIYLSNTDASKTTPLTQGDWEVSEILGVDEEAGRIYFSGRKQSRLERHLYWVDLQGQNLTRISNGAGTHTARFSPDFKHYLASHSSIEHPSDTVLRDSNGTEISVLNKLTVPAFEKYSLPKIEFKTIKARDGIELDGMVYYPADFDETKTYPALMYAYGGPGSKWVGNAWGYSRHHWLQFMANRGYIVATFDNRGTGGRGAQFKHYAYGDFGKWAVSDQIDVATHLGDLPYVDRKRMGFWGWSFGGFMAGMLMTRGEGIFAAGVAVAMVSDFRDYDTIWTERYMGLPQENPEGYEAINVGNYAKDLEGELLIVHGTGDDNVHVQNAYKFADRLVEEDKPFDMMIYPNRNHRIAGGNTQMHLYRKLTKYFDRHLKPLSPKK